MTMETDTRPADTDLCPITYGTVRRLLDLLPGMADKPHASNWPYTIDHVENLLQTVGDMAAVLAACSRTLTDDPYMNTNPYAHTGYVLVEVGKWTRPSARRTVVRLNGVHARSRQRHEPC